LRETSLLAYVEEIEELSGEAQPLDGGDDDTGEASFAAALEVDSGNDDPELGRSPSGARREQKISGAAISGSEKAFTGCRRSGACFVTCVGWKGPS
jgi:hypothetical protein